jgi:upstream activation factor subunit UAF30
MAAKKKSKGRKKSSSRKSSARKSSKSRGRKAARKGGRKTRRKSSGKKRTPNAMPRTEVTKKLWQYIKRKGLQDSKNRRMINADENLRPIFGRSQVSMFEMTRLVNNHLKNP